MSQINITRSEFQRSFRNHYLLYNKTKAGFSPCTRRLILFYAVECGLKSLILKNIGKNTYEELSEYYQTNGKRMPGHNIKEMTKEVGIETAFSLKSIQLARGGRIMSEKYNELWRYGASISNLQEEEREEQTLIDIAEWLRQRI